MPGTFLESLSKLDAALREPFYIVLIQAGTVSVTNIACYALNYYVLKYTDDPFFFAPLFALLGLFHLYVFSTWDLLQFVLLTSFACGLFFYIGILIREVKKSRIFTIANVVKIGIFFYALVSFRYHQDRSDFAEYVMTLIIMTLKVISAVRFAQEKTYNELMKGDRILYVSAPFEVIAYLIYTGWPSYKDFLSLRDRQHEKNERWWNMLMSSASRSVLFKVLSHKYLQMETVIEHIENEILRDVILMVIHAYQFRFRYYYKAQLAELEIIAAGLKRGGWTRHIVFDFMGAEFSHLLVHYFYCVNLLMGTYMRNEFSIDTLSGLYEAVINVIFIIMLVASYDVYYAVYACCFAFSMLTQRQSMLSVTTGCGNCVFYCFHGQLGPRRAPRQVPPWTHEALVLFLANQLRISMLIMVFQNSADHYTFLIRTTICLTIVDLLSAMMISTERGVSDVSPPIHRGKRRIPKC